MSNFAKTEVEYAERLKGFTRKELLKLCRAAGFAAHKLDSDEKLIHLLWMTIGRLRAGVHPTWES